MRLGLAPSLMVIAVLAGCRGPTAPDRAPIFFEDLGTYHRTIATTAPDAQRWFDQGLLFMYGFNHDEARRSFAEAARIDPSCAMAWWGQALAAGPHINNMAMDEAAARAAHEAVAAAHRNVDLYSGSVERALIEALKKRYAWPPPADRKSLDAAYADAMRIVYRRHPDDPDVAALFAESLMDLHPWDLWSKDGEPRPVTPEVIDVLNRLLNQVPDHPGGLHYLIHTLEASPHPELAKDAADRLRQRVPGSGHLVHMPAHIDMRTGNYLAAIIANQRAVQADRRYVARAGRGGLQEMYRAHDIHFLAWSAMFDGQSAVAIQAARDTVAALPPEIVAAMPQFVEGFLQTPYHALIRFGRFEDMLAEPEPDAAFAGTRAARHYARAVAFANTGRRDQAEAERLLFEREYERVPKDWEIGNNSTRTVLDVARCVLEGELDYRRGRRPDGLASLRRAVDLDDALAYDEPWGWMVPARHALGALLLEDEQFAAAEQVYRADLKRHPENGWSLHGLAECVRKQGRVEEAEEIHKRFEAAWSRADVELIGSCFCRTAP